MKDTEIERYTENREKQSCRDTETETHTDIQRRREREKWLKTP